MFLFHLYLSIKSTITNYLRIRIRSFTIVLLKALTINTRLLLKHTVLLLSKKIMEIIKSNENLLCKLR